MVSIRFLLCWMSDVFPKLIHNCKNIKDIWPWFLKHYCMYLQIQSIFSMAKKRWEVFHLLMKDETWLLNPMSTLSSSFIGWIIYLAKLHTILVMCHCWRQIHSPQFKVKHVILLTSCSWVPVSMFMPEKTCNSVFSLRKKICIVTESLSVLCAQIT